MYKLRRKNRINENSIRTIMHAKFTCNVPVMNKTLSHDFHNISDRTSR